MNKKMLINVFFLLTSIACIALLITGCNIQQAEKKPDQQSVELNISAAASLKDVLSEIQAIYQTKHPETKLVYNFGASGSLQKQIEQGAPADLFISAAPKQIDELDKKNMIVKQSKKNLVENQLVLIIPQDSKGKLEKYEDLCKSEIKKIGLGEPEAVPAGQYAKEVLTNMNLWDDLKEKMVFAKDVRTVLTYVETGNVEAGIVYKTDSLISNKVKIAATAPAGTHKPIVYPVAIIATSEKQQTAQEFLNFLSGPEGKTLFEKYGFAISK